MEAVWNILRQSVRRRKRRTEDDLIDAEQTVPHDTLFCYDLFNETCEGVNGRNEAMVVRDITPAVCPSAQVLKIYDARRVLIKQHPRMIH